MESFYFINLIFIFVLNVFLFISGICLNSVVIISFWRSVQLRKKLCYFMIMILSCCDLLAVLTNSLPLAVIVMLWLTEKLDVNIRWLYVAIGWASAFQIISLLALLVMSFDRYLATSYPLFHRTSVTKGRLLTLLAILTIIKLSLSAISANDAIISYEVYMLIIVTLFTPPMFFINGKLFLVVKRNRRSKEISPARKKTILLTKISSCLIAVACYVVLSIPAFVYIGIKMNCRVHTTFTFDNAYLAGLWTITLASLNSALNCLIFYWKNKVLRTEGWKVIKSVILWQEVKS